MDAKIADIITRMKGRESPNLVTAQTSDLAEVMALVAEEQAQSADKVKDQTEKLINLTWGLFWLTLILAFVAAVQLYVMLK
jgi:hypothetical protein